MPQYSHNSPYYELHLSELEDDAVRVLAFEGIENISRLFKYSFQLLSENAELNAEDILNKKATFIMNRGDEDPLTICGIISRFEQRGQSPDYVSYYAELVPKMWRLGLNFQSRIFQNMDIEKMLTEVLETSEFSSDDFEFQLNETYPELEFAVQYRESDFDFINRRLEHFGIYYYFEHRDENDVIVFTDANDNLPKIDTGEDVLYNPNKDPLSEIETVSQIIYQGQVVTGKTQLKDYNYRDPSKDLLSESQIIEDSPGTYSNYGDHYKDENEGEFLARVRNEEIVCNSVNYKGKSDCRLLRAGYKFTMGEHYREDWNMEYLLTHLLTRGNQRGLFGILQPSGKVEPTYENYFEALPADIIFRPQRLTQHPKIHGILNAKVDAAGDGEQAEVDDQGRYKVILPFDLSGQADGEASHYIRMIQPYAGPNYGMHFPLHKDTEVLLTFIDGNPDRPIISGAVPNPETISPVTNVNQTKSVIRDNYGNEIIMDGTPGDEHIKLYSPHHKSRLTIGKSVTSFTDSIAEDIWFGDKFEWGGGASTEFFFGTKFEAAVATELSMKLASEMELFFGTKQAIGAGTEYELAYMPKIEMVSKDISSDAKLDHLITAGDGLCLLGGKASKIKKRSAVVNADENHLALSFGNITGRMADTDAWYTKFVGFIPLIWGIVGHIVAIAASEVPRHAANVGKADDADVGYQEGLTKEQYDAKAKAEADKQTLWEGIYAGIGGGASLAAGIVLGIIQVIFTSITMGIFKDEKLEPFYHENETATQKADKIRWLSLNDDGILASVNPEKLTTEGTIPHQRMVVKNNTKMDAKIAMDSDGRIYLRSYAGKKRIVVGVGDKGDADAIIFLREKGILIKSGVSSVSIKKDGNIEINSNKNLSLLAKGKITLDSDTAIDLIAPEVNCCDGSFKQNSLEAF